MLIEQKLSDAACEWFAFCHNRATGTRWHPILGDVPICDRCNDHCERWTA